MEYLISQELINLIFNEYSYSEAKLLITLIGNREGFLVSQKFFENCGLSESSYKSARKNLSEAGIIDYEPYRHIGVNFPALYRKLGKEISTEEKPTFKEVKKYIAENGIKVDAEKFFNYYEETNWTTKNGIKIHDWKKKIDEWAKRNKSNLKKDTGKQKKSWSTDDKKFEYIKSYDEAEDVIKYWNDEKQMTMEKTPSEEEREYLKKRGKLL